MTKLIIALTFLFCANAVFAQSYSTNFPLTENPISEGGKWINGKVAGIDWNNVATVPGEAYGAVIVGGYNDDIAVLTTTYAAGQYAQATVHRASGYSPSGGHEIELLLHFKVTANNARGYEVLWGISGYIAIVRWNGPLGDYTPLYDPGTGPTPVDGDVLRAEISGGVIKVYRNGSLLATGPANTTWTDGQPGVGFWPTDRGGVTPANYGWKNFTAGNLGTGVDLKPELSVCPFSISPNPFSERVALGIASGAVINIYDLQGRLVNAWGSENRDRTVTWNGNDLFGKPVACGNYVISYKTIAGTQIKPLLKLR